jgi:hypothetical protein
MVRRLSVVQTSHERSYNQIQQQHCCSFPNSQNCIARSWALRGIWLLNLKKWYQRQNPQNGWLGLQSFYQGNGES